MNGTDGFSVVSAGTGVGHRHAHRTQTDASDLQTGEPSLSHAVIVLQRW